MEKSTETYEKLVKWAEKRGFNNIKVNSEGFDLPSSFSKNNGEDVIIPDMTAQNSDVKYFFEIAVKPKDEKLIQEIVSKWKLLSTMAKIKGGKLYLFAPHGNKSFTEGLIRDYNIDAMFMFIPQLQGF